MIHRFVATVPDGGSAAGPRGSASRQLSVEALDDGKYRVTLDGTTRVVDARRVEPGVWSILDDAGGASRTVDVDTNGDAITATTRGRVFAFKLADARKALEARIAPAREATGPQAVRAPMPGKVIKVLVAVGDAVKAGQGVAVVEAMKMENELRAPRDGKVAEIAAKEGQPVEMGQELMKIS